MKALTLWEPYATLVAIGVKRIETRSWPCPPALIGERIAIHAAARKPSPVKLGPWSVVDIGMTRGPVLETFDTESKRIVNAVLSPGHVVCTARVAACLPMEAPSDAIDSAPDALVVGPGWLDLWQGDAAPVDVSGQLPFGDFAPGRWAWLLDDVRPLDVPVPAKGKQGLWEWAA